MFGQLKEDNLLKKALKITIFFAIFLTPLVFSSKHLYFFSTPKYVLMATLGTVCFVLFAIYFLETQFLFGKKTKIALGLAGGFVIWLFLSSIFSPEPTTSFWSNFGRHTGFFAYFFSLIFFLSALFIFDRKTLYAPLQAFALGGVFAAVSVFLSPALFNINLFILKNSGNAGTFGNSTYAGIFLAFSVFSSLILFFQEEIKRKKWLWLGCFFLTLFSPIFINFKNIFSANLAGISSLAGEARAGLISVIGGFLLALIAYFYFHPKGALSWVSKITLILLLAAGAYLFVGLVSEDSRIHNVFENRKEGVRFIYWDMAMIGVGERPILGFGLDNFSIVRDKYFNPRLHSPQFPKETWADKPHNVIYEIAYAAGTVGLALYLSLIGFAAVSLIRKLSQAEDKDRITAALFLGLLAAYSFQLFFAFDTVSSLSAYFVTLALIIVFCYGKIAEVKKRELAPNVRKLSILGLILIGAFAGYQLSFKVNQESKSIRKINSVSIPSRVAQFEKVMNTSPVGGLETESQHIDLLVEKYKKNWPDLDEKTRAAAKTELEFLLRYSMGKSDAHPRDLRFALVAAKVANGLYGTSSTKNIELLNTGKKYASRAIENSPGGELGYKVMAEILLAEGKFEEALEFADMLVGQNGRVAEFHNIAIFIARLTKNQNLIQEKTERAENFIPQYEYGMGR